MLIMRRRDLTIEGKDMVIQDILEQAIIRGASDIFIVAGAMLSFKINGEIQKVADYKLMPKDTLELISQRYNVFYEAIASNVFPDIKVFKKE